MMDIATAPRIRPVTAADIAPLSDAIGAPPHRIERRWQETLAVHGEMYVAELNGSPVGSVCINEREERPGLLHLFALDVAPEHRNRGIGSRLIARVEEESRVKRLAGVYLECGIENPNARRLYERLGYAQDGRPFLNSWNRYHEDGTFDQEIVEEVCRLIKRFA